MTETQSQRIHGIVYSNDSREELAERIVMLEDENARLRSCLSDDAENARLIMGENAKLRKLLSQALAAHELDTFFEYFEPHSFWVGWCEDVHEMGIEVDE